MWHAPKLLDRLKCECKMKTTEDQRIGACSLACSTLKGREVCWSSGIGLGEWQAFNHSHGSAQTKQQVS
jgi:hypothetical protein